MSLCRTITGLSLSYYGISLTEKWRNRRCCFQLQRSSSIIPRRRINLLIKIRINWQTANIATSVHHCKKISAISSLMSCVRLTTWILFWIFVEMKVNHCYFLFLHLFAFVIRRLLSFVNPINDTSTYTS